MDLPAGATRCGRAGTRTAYDTSAAGRLSTTTPTTVPSAVTTGAPLSPGSTTVASSRARRSWTTPALTSSTRSVIARSTVVGSRPVGVSIVAAVRASTATGTAVPIVANQSPAARTVVADAVSAATTARSVGAEVVATR